jgi:glycosyltransferase involved in cell wall biosynthesis
LVLLEAMSFGKPCIAAPGAAAEIVQHEETGLIVDPAKTRDLTLAIVRLFQQTSVADGMGAAGARRVAALFSPARFASDVARAMAPLVKATPPC